MLFFFQCPNNSFYTVDKKRLSGYYTACCSLLQCPVRSELVSEQSLMSQMEQSKFNGYKVVLGYRRHLLKITAACGLDSPRRPLKLNFSERLSIESDITYSQTPPCWILFCLSKSLIHPRLYKLLPPKLLSASFIPRSNIDLFRASWQRSST